MYSVHVRYLRITQHWTLPDEVFEDYLRLFPDRSLLPRVQSINMWASSVSPSPVQWSRFLLRSSTPAENQPSASASALKHLRISYTLSTGDREGFRLLALDLVAFQHSNLKLGGGLEVFKMVDLYSFQPNHTLAYQDVIENAFVLPPPENVDSPADGLHHIEVAHFLCGLPDFFGRVAKMRALEHLKIVILKRHGDDKWEVEDKKKSVQHSLSSIEIEAFWWDLSPAINLCASPSATAQLRTLRLYYSQMDRALTRANITQVLDLPADIIPPDHLETLTVELVGKRQYTTSYLNGLALATNALQPLLRYRQMVKLHLDLPRSICLDIKFLHALAAVMGETLSLLVILKAITVRHDYLFQPVLTVEDLSAIAGVLFPRLETLGLEVPWRDTSSSCTERNCSVASSLLRVLHVGTKRTLVGQESSNVAIFLKGRFPGLQYLYRHRVGHYEDDGWQPIMTANGYSGRYYEPGSGQ